MNGPDVFRQGLAAQADIDGGDTRKLFSWARICERTITKSLPTDVIRYQHLMSPSGNIEHIRNGKRKLTASRVPHISAVTVESFRDPTVVD